MMNNGLPTTGRRSLLFKISGKAFQTHSLTNPTICPPLEGSGSIPSPTFQPLLNVLHHLAAPVINQSLNIPGT